MRIFLRRIHKWSNFLKTNKTNYWFSEILAEKKMTSIIRGLKGDDNRICTKQRKKITYLIG